MIFLARASNQKLKLLYLCRILTEKTDEWHPISVQSMIEELKKYDITAERKSIYDDLEALRTFGLDIIQSRGRTTGYYVGSRTFELPEIRVLMDCVQSSKFITAKKTEGLLRKLSSLASEGQAQGLNGQIYVRNRAKSDNESAYYNVDKLARAIDLNVKVTFLYFDYTPDKERHYRKDGALYCVSPFALLCEDDKYYLLAWSSEAGMIRHYRVDHMSTLEFTDEPREGQSAFENVDMSAYTKRVFGMFTGDEQMVSMRFVNSFAGTVMDKFGRDVPLCIEDEEHFSVTTAVEVSPQFFGWVFGLGPGAEIIAPASVRREYAARMEEILSQYR